MNIISRLLAPLGGIVLVLGLTACVAPQEATTPAETVTPAEPAAPIKDIWTAAGEGDLAELEAHKAAGTNLDDLQLEAGVTPLMIAVIVGEQQAVEWLLVNGADANAEMRDGGNALHGAAFVGNSLAAAMLLERGVDVNALSSSGGVRDILALDWATTEYISSMLELDLTQEEVEEGRAEIAAMLGGGEGGGDIWSALLAGDISAVRAALQAGADANALGADGSPPLVFAATNSNPELAAAILAAGGDVNMPNQTNGATPLHAAAFLGHAEVARLLLDKGADKDAMSNDGMTAMQMTELDWPTTEYIAGMLEIAVEEEAVMAGRAKIAEMLAQ